MKKIILFIAVCSIATASFAQNCGKVVWKKPNGDIISVVSSNGVNVVTKDYNAGDCAPSTPAPVVVDTDGDGIADKDDKCPTIAGVASEMGCPKVKKDAVDTDKDGVLDPLDVCPNTPSGVSVDVKGCAKDTDGDGIADYKDQCPSVAGVASLGGCPDTDGDGVADKNDKCPSVAGIVALGGCPDTDGDGITDADDKCPNEIGIAENKGCPEIKEEDKQAFTDALEGVKFYSGKDVMTSSSKPLMDKVYQVLVDYPAMKLQIDGYTDSAGREDSNLALSKKRAAATYNFLVEKGIDASRLSYEGYGEESPIADNSTSAGRAKNRRVEFTHSF